MSDTYPGDGSLVGLTVRLHNRLFREGIHTAEALASKSAPELLRIRHFGRGMLLEVETYLQSLGLQLAADNPLAPLPDRSPLGCFGAVARLTREELDRIVMEPEWDSDAAFHRLNEASGDDMETAEFVHAILLGAFVKLCSEVTNQGDADRERWESWLRTAPVKNRSFFR